MATPHSLSVNVCIRNASYGSSCYYDGQLADSTLTGKLMASLTKSIPIQSENDEFALSQRILKQKKNRKLIQSDEWGKNVAHTRKVRQTFS